MPEETTLSKIIPSGIFVGISLILRQGDRFLYGIRPARQVADRQVLELTGIGGGMEEEDRSFTAGAVREAQEEIGCLVKLMPSPVTLVVRTRDEIEWVVVTGDERPVAIVFRNHRTPPHQPWHQDNQGEGCLIVFVAEIEGRPWPTMELPHLIWLTPEQIFETATRDVPLNELLEDGVELIGGQLEAPPENYLVRLTDSQEAIALALGEKSIPFYNSLG